MRKSTWVRAGLLFAGLFLIVAIWQWTPLRGLTDPDKLAGWGQILRGHWWGYVAAVAVYIIGGLIVFPVSVLIAASVLIFGPLNGFFLGFVASIISAIVGYFVGVRLGKKLPNLFLQGSRITAVSEALARRGVLSVALIRQLPVAPFSVVNFSAGISHIRFLDFLVGTALGVLPWLLALTLLTDQFLRMLESPSLLNGLILVGVLVVATICLFLVVKFARRWLGRK